MKSAGLKTIQKAEPFIRKIVSGKLNIGNSKNRGLNLTSEPNSGILNVYSGQLKERGGEYVIDENRNK